MTTASTEEVASASSAPERRSRPHVIAWWALRFVIYYTVFELLAPLAAFFGGRAGRILEGVVFGAVLASIHPAVRRWIKRRRQ